MRPIDADALLKEAWFCDLDHWSGKVVDEDIINEAPTVDATPKWIRAEDMLPEDDVNVLVYAIGNNENDVVAMTSYTHNMYGYNIEGWRSPWQYFFYEHKITHWMPLPEPPKE